MRKNKIMHFTNKITVSQKGTIRFPNPAPVGLPLHGDNNKAWSESVQGKHLLQGTNESKDIEIRNRSNLEASEKSLFAQV